MKKIFIPAKSLEKIEIKNPEKLPAKVGLASSIQFLDQLKEIKKLLESKGKKVELCGQVLGCDATACKNKKVDAFLYVGDGRFHPIAIALQTGKKVYILVDGEVSEFDSKIKEEYERRKKAGLSRFYTYEDVGILVCTKPGQNNMKKAVEFKKKHKEKKCYIFVFNDLDFGQLENFPFVQVWVNTACPRLIDDYEKFNRPVINIDEIE